MSLNPTVDPIARAAAEEAATLRPVNADELELLRYWHRQPHVIAAVGDNWGWEEELSRLPEWREQFIAEVGGKPIGFVQIIDPAREDTKYWGGIAAGHRAIDIWIGEKDYLGRGYGTQIMRQVIEQSFADPSVTALIVDPRDNNLRACHFYERLGFEFVVRRCFDDDYCAVYRLTRPTSASGTRKTA